MDVDSLMRRSDVRRHDMQALGARRFSARIDAGRAAHTVQSAAEAWLFFEAANVGSGTLVPYTEAIQPKSTNTRIADQQAGTVVHAGRLPRRHRAGGPPSAAPCP